LAGQPHPQADPAFYLLCWRHLDESSRQPLLDSIPSFGRISHNYYRCLLQALEREPRVPSRLLDELIYNPSHRQIRTIEDMWSLLKILTANASLEQHRLVVGQIL
jgi:hypothetical protein